MRDLLSPGQFDFAPQAALVYGTQAGDDGVRRFTKEFARQSETGWIVPPGDVDALAQALDQALSRRKELR